MSDRCWIEIEDGFLTSKPKDGPHPRNKPWEYLLIACQVRHVKSRYPYLRRKRYIHVLTAPTKRGVDAELRKFVARKDVKVLPPGQKQT